MSFKKFIMPTRGKVIVTIILALIIIFWLRATIITTCDTLGCVCAPLIFDYNCDSLDRIILNNLFFLFVPLILVYLLVSFIYIIVNIIKSKNAYRI
jgi:F0F1-type ATP synthase assembly protein I